MPPDQPEDHLPGYKRQGEKGDKSNFNVLDQGEKGDESNFNVLDQGQSSAFAAELPRNEVCST
jgi:hypothetical protein